MLTTFVATRHAQTVNNVTLARPSTITPRRPHFDWSETPINCWVPGDLDATCMLNAMHVLFPEGERAFCRVLSSALDQIDDDAVVRDIKGFLAQEGLHARAHTGAFAQLAASTPQIEWTQEAAARAFRFLLGAGKTRNRPLLAWRLASVAAIEHLTTAIGEWTMNNERFAEHGCDAQMSALVKWHGAEEIEHRSVAFDAHRAVQPRLSRPVRVTAMAFWLPIMTLLWVLSAQALLWHVESRPRRRLLSPRAVRRAIRNGLVPDLLAIAKGAAAFCKAGYHPSTHVAPEVVAAAESWLSGAAMRQHTRASA